MARKSIQCDHDKEAVNFPAFSSDDPLVYMLFNKVSQSEYEDKFNAMLHIGALALIEDRVAHLIASAEKDIYPELERFKLLFEQRKIEFETTAMAKGEKAEVDIVDELSNYAAANGWSDDIVQSGKIKGELEGNKTGDVLATIELVPGGDDIQLGIEVKLDKSVTFGDPESEDIGKGKPDKKGDEVKGSDFDTAWSQLLETKANRTSPFSIIVFDAKSVHSSVLKHTEDIAYLPGIPGFVVIIDGQAGRFENLLIAYRLAREMALFHVKGDLEVDIQVLELLVKRILHYVNDAKDVSNLVRKNVDNAVKLNKDVQAKLKHLIAHSEYTHEFLKEYLKTKNLDAKKLLEFYYASPAAEVLRENKDENKKLEKEIKALADS
ncbi:MAG: hypothetical protein HOA04_00115 [Euryarchaeota archaeon]|nr:hypothetical protein [Euryarchaeota archaeon]